MNKNLFYNKVTNSEFDIIVEFGELLSSKKVDYCVIPKAIIKDLGAKFKLRKFI